MTPENREKLQFIIGKQLTRLREAIVELEAHAESLSPDNAIGRLSRMDAIEAQSVNTIKLERNREREQQLLQAEKRLHSKPDEFGLCDICGDEIAMTRLELLPETRHCVNCAK